jgi:hypothetical protein
LTDTTRFDLTGQRVSRVVLDFAVTITTYEGFELRIESGLQSTHQVMESLHERAILSASASQEGTLTVEFDGDFEVVVSPDQSYEAWTLAGPHGIIAVCTPGGGLTTWSTQPTAD